MITHELLTKLRRENQSLVGRVDALRGRMEKEGSPELGHELAMFGDELRDYVGLVDALVDALLPDIPRRQTG